MLPVLRLNPKADYKLRNGHLWIYSNEIDNKFKAIKSLQPGDEAIIENSMGKALGLDNKWAYNVIKQVGNFGEMWDRNITPMGVPRGINNLWTKGGLQYAPPIR